MTTADPPEILPEAKPILGTPVHCASYETGLRACHELARRHKASAVSACNTHLVALARTDPEFRASLGTFDLVMPDGYPLVWHLNARGAGLKDRVYGPYFMRHALEHSPAPWRHFFFGGTPECLDRLVSAARVIQPNVEIAGTFSPPFRHWTDQDEEDFATLIANSRADFIWVALGGGRQEKWIAKNLHRHQHGVFIGIGDAFELLAGSRPFAPKWMQRHGLTWLYRLSQEPSRLFGRYLKFNSLFLYFSARDALLGTPNATSTRGVTLPPAKIGFLGSRGVPARYAGFEVVVEQIGSRLAARGHSVTVYNRLPHYRSPEPIHLGMRTIALPTIPTKTLDTITHTALSAIDAIFRRYDLIYLCGVGNAIIGGFLHLLGMTVIINVDGADFRRAKWGSFARRWLRFSEMWATRMADAIIADNSEIVGRYERDYGVRPLHISYGCTIRNKPVSCGELDKWSLEPRGYMLFVSRLSPENEADLLLRAYKRYGGPLKLVVCGGSHYERGYQRELQELAGPGVIFTGPRYGDSYLELSQNARFFVMPASIEATRLVLLDQLGMGSAILYKDCAATREVVADAAMPFEATTPEDSLTEKITLLANHPDLCEELGRKAMARALAEFDWDRVLERYEVLFEELGVRRSVPAR